MSYVFRRPFDYRRRRWPPPYAGITAVDVYRNDANLQGLWLLEETSGTRYDETSNNNDLTDNNTVGYSTDSQEGDNSADFEYNNSEYLSIADNASLSITGDLSFGCWLKMESDTSDDELLINKYNAATNNRSYILYANRTGANTFELVAELSSDGTSATACTGGTTIAPGTWYHATAVYNGTDIRIYLDGYLDGNGANNPKTYSSGIYDGNAEFRIGRFWDGLIDEAFVFDDALSAGEVLGIYQSGIQAVAEAGLAGERGVARGVHRGVGRGV